ncbi:hypothetical protein SAMN05444397_102555 [Flavobacterium aquidurense]|uniref:Glycosyltransferase family 52 n=1 Tax=Flavobacterium frigidimaris TaxID=262320 RepID=A0ABX4BMJ5_FLAFR|nr:polysialyltransferase family glycosyltransferase [Flavobacterium frigidimaris]OXA77567.1 hypothetical protein B0A65_16050 [Flavobacterium frigidimaris]SDY89627.1 hypothetical protein SAMN05444397_102555 [Flavobacterium aquidurense]
MKHIFLVHTHITYIVAQSIIESLSLKNEEIFFISTRNYKIDFTDQINLNAEFELLNNTNYSNFFLKWQLIKKVDEKLLNANIGLYQIYLPHIAHPLFQILGSNKKCTKINIMEEGSNCLSYRLYNPPVNIKKRLIALIFNKSGLWGQNRYFRVSSNSELKYFDKKLLPVFYGISPKSFQNVIGYEKRIISIHQEKTAVSKQIPDNVSVLLLESIIEQDNLSSSLFFDSIELLAKKLNSEEVYLKFHPYQNAENRKHVITILEKYTNVKLIADDIVMEKVFLCSKNLKVYGFTTSLLFYAKSFGHEAFSFAYLWKDDLKYKNYTKFNDFNIEEFVQRTNN